MNILKITTRKDDLDQGFYTYQPEDCIPYRMPYLAQQLMIDFIEGQKLPLRLVNTSHCAILYDKLMTQKIALIYLNQDQQLAVEIFPGMELNPNLNAFMSNIEGRYGVGVANGVHR